MATKRKAAKRPTKKVTKKPARRDGRPIDKDLFLKWLVSHTACYIGLAECKARLATHVRMGCEQPVEVMLVEAVEVSSRWWPRLTDAMVSAPYLPAYLRWLGHIITGAYDYEYDGLLRAFQRNFIRAAMKRDGFEG